MSRGTIENLELVCHKFILIQLVDELSVVAPHGTKSRLTAFLDELQATLKSCCSSADLSDCFADRSDASAGPAAPLDRCVDRILLQHQLDEITHKYERLKADTKTMEQTLLDELEDVKFVCAAEEKMCDSWENAQLAQEAMARADQADGVARERRETERSVLVEQLAAESVDIYGQMKADRLDERIAAWRRRYVSESRSVAGDQETVDATLAELRMEREQCERVYEERRRVIAR